MKYTDTATTSQYPQPRQTYTIVTSDDMTPRERTGFYFVLGVLTLSVLALLALMADRILTGE